MLVSSNNLSYTHLTVKKKDMIGHGALILRMLLIYWRINRLAAARRSGFQSWNAAMSGVKKGAQGSESLGAQSQRAHRRREIELRCA